MVKDWRRARTGAGRAFMGGGCLGKVEKNRLRGGRGYGLGKRCGMVVCSGIAGSACGSHLPAPPCKLSPWALSVPFLFPSIPVAGL